jgi:Flp pilus assembly pilin Flp
MTGGKERKRGQAMQDQRDSERGAGLAEYAFLLVLIAVACVVVVTLLGTTISGAYSTAIGMF